ncbi:hypothetical protein ACTHQF_12630 [Pedobacter sp. SAFR-022]|uniref:hypothetical protein n=1 Tax=Pedobacter sp. SAFR-022 TaxID=3436861 RepID=UPI003F7FF095
MFDQILNVVKEQMANHPQAAAAIPADKADDVHKEVASHIEQGLKGQASSSGGIGGLLWGLTGAAGSGNPLTGAIEGGLVSSLASKFGLPPAVAGAIAGALPGILQKFAQKATDPGDKSVNLESITKSLGGGGLAGGLGNILGKF